MFVLENLGRRQPVGSPAHRGTAVEDGVTAGLMDPAKSLEDCSAVALKKYDSDHRPVRRQAARGIPRDDSRHGEIGAGRAAPLWRPDAHPAIRENGSRTGLAYPIVGYLDYRWEQHGILVDLKTTEKLPSSIKIPHARQVALYATMTGDNVDARLTYCTPKKRATYQLENTRDHLTALHQIALRCEAFLALSDDPAVFYSDHGARFRVLLLGRTGAPDRFRDVGF
jgi:hypothetical protein